MGNNDWTTEARPISIAESLAIYNENRQLEIAPYLIKINQRLNVMGPNPGLVISGNPKDSNLKAIFLYIIELYKKEGWEFSLKQSESYGNDTRLEIWKTS